ncbi:cell division protein ZapE [Tistrella bauzanensis]|uniref:Cell division protein ZapE n=1 Tax=Tistrella bauzanensis TaxID=657419 RepID=A0ABQ1ID37_9PROT|nr:cell division protein ZapE [Tistrella bauzanensis]GGB31594.1 cell division protein ZapE [Tistrella bauzanensis]
MSDPSREDPSSQYARMVAEGRLTADPAQAAAVERLTVLLRRMGAEPAPPPPAPASRKRGLLGRLFGGAEADDGPPPMPAGPRGLYLWGGVGRGKSMLMDMAFRAAPVAPKRRVHFHAFMLDIHARLHAWRTTGDQDREPDPLPRIADAVAAEARLLCFDEFQVRDVADAMILGRLFTHVLARGVFVIATSNRPPEDLYLDGLQRDRFLPFIRLVRDSLEVMELVADRDYRLDRLTLMPVYHVPADASARRALDEAFSDLAGGAAPARAVLDVSGRRIEVPMAAGGVARFGFADLCAKPLGAADYIEIARQHHTVIIDGIPAMGPEKRDQAARFVTLVDELYEHRVKLVCSAAAWPDDLYPAGDGSFEFARTASRLAEMQSKEYLALPHLT